MFGCTMNEKSCGCSQTVHQTPLRVTKVLRLEERAVEQRAEEVMGEMPPFKLKQKVLYLLKAYEGGHPVGAS